MAAASVIDTLGNRWSLDGRSLRCEPGKWGLRSAPEQVQPAVELVLPFGATAAAPTASAIAVDAAGCLWLLADGLRSTSIAATSRTLLLRLDPRAGRTVEAVQKHGWTRFDPPAASLGAAIALTRLSSGHVALQTAGGEAFAVDIEGVAQVHTAVRVADLPQNEAWDPAAAPDLPFGNHDIHAVELGGRLYTTGGLAMVRLGGVAYYKEQERAYRT